MSIRYLFIYYAFAPFCVNPSDNSIALEGHHALKGFVEIESAVQSVVVHH